MPRQLRSILLILAGTGLAVSSAMKLFAQGRIEEVGRAGVVICLALLGITLVVEGVAKLTASKSSNPTKVVYPGLPLIRMAFNNQEFIVTAWEDMGDHWLLKGHITKWGSYSGVDEISFRVPKGIVEVRLGYYVNHNYVLVDTSNPNDPGPNGYLSDTNRVRWDTFPYPKPMM